MGKKSEQLTKDGLRKFLSETIQIGTCKGSSIRYKSSNDTYWSLYLFTVIKLSKSDIKALSFQLQK